MIPTWRIHQKGEKIKIERITISTLYKQRHETKLENNREILITSTVSNKEIR